MERYIPLTVMRAAQKESQRFFDTAKINHTELKFEDVTIKHTTFVYAAELGNNQSVMNKHFEHLHDLRIGDMDKFSKICVDKSKAFSLAKALDFYKSHKKENSERNKEYRERGLLQKIHPRPRRLNRRLC